MVRRKYTKEHWQCEFVGKGGEDLRDIIKRQLVRYINEQNEVPVIKLIEPKRTKKGS